MLNQLVTVEVESSVAISSSFCYLSARNLHLDLIKLSFVSNVATFNFTPTAIYTPEIKIKCLAFDDLGQRHEAKLSLPVKEMACNVSTK